ncbi:MAG TPA: hypothetical protein VL346_05355 [Acidobacteriaceae bacterium]|nr:hypothetical protein [Acidobacteriaceae bacterium]
MNQIKSIGGAAAMLAAGLLCVSGATAWAGSRPSAPASHPAPHASAPASHAPAARPAGGGMAGHSSAPAGHAGATAGGGHAGPTANGGHAGPTANGGHSGPTANGAHGGPTAAGGHGGPTAGGAGGHGAMTANNAHPGAGGGNMAGHGGGAPHGTMASHSAISRPVPHGANDHMARNGSAIRTRSNGRVSDVHDARRGMDIHHGLDGGRRVEMRRHDGSRLVAERGRRGFVEHGYHYRGHDFARRSYYYHGHEYGRYYRGYPYHGVYLNVYAPGYYYGPGFYGWAYNPWAAPIAYGWGWGGSPWYGYYGGYFTPWATYPSAAFWLTDYIVAANLEAAYAARQAAAADAAAAAGEAAQQVAMSEEVKQQIAAEVKAQIALENQEATQTAANQDVDAGSSGVARMMADGHPHVFVVGTGLDLTDSNGQECAVSEGDALALRTAPAGDATSADLVVLASKGGKECASGGTVSVGLSDLQEMQNHLRETIDTGLKELQDKQGKGGLPAAPASAQIKPTESPYAAVAPPPSPDDEKDIQAQAQQADSAESEVAKEASADDGGAPISTPAADQPAKAPVTVALGQTMDQVKAILGNPMKTADLGAKTIYYYDGMKVVFKSGKVSDVE